MGRTRLMIAGLPASGKTTYLAALWHVLGNSKRSALVRDRLPADATYLTQLSMQWLGFEEVQHTAENASYSTTISARHRDGLVRDTFEVHLPDTSGEAFAHAFELRGWSSELNKSAEEADGLMLFIGKIKDVMLIDDVACVAPTTTRRKSSVPEEEKELVAGREWRVTDAPTQAALVDLLQMIGRQRSTPLPVAVIASAWDVWEKSSTDPGKWVATKVPLLEQFLTSQRELFPWTVFGISAQGCAYTGTDANTKRAAAEAKAKLAEVDPCERPLVVHAGQRSSDLTLPIAWLAKAQR